MALPHTRHPLGPYPPRSVRLQPGCTVSLHECDPAGEANLLLPFLAFRGHVAAAQIVLCALHNPNCPAHMCVVQGSYMCTRGVKSALDNALGNKPNKNNTTITMPTCANVKIYNTRLYNKVSTVHTWSSHTSSCWYSQSSSSSYSTNGSHHPSSFPSPASSSSHSSYCPYSS